MTYDTLAIARSAHSNYVPHLRDAHHYVRLLSGRWCAVFGLPDSKLGLHQVTRNTWHLVKP